MPQQRVQRKLATILMADVEGYSYLMHIDEESTLKALEKHREVITKLVSRYDGRIFNTGGDSVLIGLASAVEAVRCAVAFQQETSGGGGDLHQEHALQIRVGINLGDVMIRDGDQFGDGVNIAARLEGLPE